MTRAEFEARLLRDEAFRERLEAVGLAARRLRDAEADVRARLKERNALITSLARGGVPLATLARRACITPQRLGHIVKGAA